MAEFYVPPPGLALDDLAERVAARVVDMYSAVEAELLAEVARTLSRGLPANATLETQLAVVRALQARARELVGNIPPDLADQVMRLAMTEGTAAAAAELRLTAGMPRTSDITSTAANTLALVAQDLGNAFDQVHLRILRYPIDAVGNFIGTDAYQQTMGRHVATRTVGALTTDEVRLRVLADFLDQGITGFTDRIGRRWRIGSYTEMATRSATARAFVDAGNDRRLQAGFGLVSVLGNNDACHLCAPWFGKVLSIDGTGPGTHLYQHPYDDGVMVEVTVAARLEDARAAGLMHPNCACTTAAYTPGLSIPVSAPGYDAEAAEGRDRQRALERDVRDARRKLAVAEALDDSPRAARMAARVRDKQKQLRDLVKATGQKRRYDREKVAWADGPSKRPAQPPVRPVVPGPGDGPLQPGPTRVPILLDDSR